MNINRTVWDLRRFGLTPEFLLRRVCPSADEKIICFCIPKSGTHLLERVLCLMPGYYRRFVRTITTENLVAYGGLDSLLSRLRRGQILMTHLPFRQEYKDAVDRLGVRSIFLCRDPRDILLSNVYYVMARRAHAIHDRMALEEDLQKRISLQISGDDPSGVPPAVDWIGGFARWRDEADLSLRYEELVGGKGGSTDDAQEKSITAIMQILGLPDAVKARSMLMHRVHSDVSPTFRKGTINQWREGFDSETKQLFNEKCGALLDSFGYER